MLLSGLILILYRKFYDSPRPCQGILLFKRVDLYIYEKQKLHLRFLDFINIVIIRGGFYLFYFIFFLNIFYHLLNFFQAFTDRKLLEKLYSTFSMNQ